MQQCCIAGVDFKSGLSSLLITNPSAFVYYPAAVSPPAFRPLVANIILNVDLSHRRHSYRTLSFELYTHVSTKPSITSYSAFKSHILQVLQRLRTIETEILRLIGPIQEELQSLT